MDAPLAHEQYVRVLASRDDVQAFRDAYHALTNPGRATCPPLHSLARLLRIAGQLDRALPR